MLNPVDLVKLVATGNRAMFGFVRRRMQPNIMAPFIGAVFVREGKYSRVSSFHGGSEVLTRLAESAAYVARSLSLLPKGQSIIDCRNGYMVLNRNETFHVWNPFERGRWHPIPKYDHHEDRILSCAIVYDGESGTYSLVLFCVCEATAVLKIFNFRTNQWQRSVTTLALMVDEIVPHPSVHINRFLYSLSSEGRIIRSNLILSVADTIPLPRAPKYSQHILSKINGHLCLATADIASVCVFQYEDCKWQLRWKFQAPRASSWLKVLGCGEKNGLLVVETGLERSYALHVEKGSWTLLQGHPAGHDVFPLEITNPFAYPFPGYGIDTKIENYTIGTEKQNSNFSSKKNINSKIKESIENMFRNKIE